MLTIAKVDGSRGDLLIWKDVWGWGRNLKQKSKVPQDQILTSLFPHFLAIVILSGSLNDLDDLIHPLIFTLCFAAIGLGSQV